MSRMADLHIEISELVGDALSTPGVLSDYDVLNYVNERCSTKVTLEQIDNIMEQFFGDDSCDYYWNFTNIVYN